MDEAAGSQLLGAGADATAPIVSVVVPARDAVATIGRTLRSLRRQTMRRWEAIVVDDGSTDATARNADAAASADARVRLLRHATAAGPSAARNTGLRVARGDWVLFLDADDTVSPSHLSRLLRRVAREPGADAVCCDTLRLDRDGRVIERMAAADVEHDLRGSCVRQVPASMHAFLIRRGAALAVGGFDETLRTHEDWDFWIRVAAVRLRVLREPRPLAFYWGGRHSLTRDGSRMVRDHRRTAERVRALFPDYGEGAFRYEMTISFASSLLWNAAVAIGAGRDWHPVLDAAFERDDLADRFSPDLVAPAFLAGLALGAECPPDAIAARWDRMAPDATRFFASFEARAGVAGLAYGLTIAIERALLAAERGRARSRVLTRSVGVRVGPRALRRGVVVPPGREALVATFAGSRRTLPLPCFGATDASTFRRRLGRGIADEATRSGALGRLLPDASVLGRIDAALLPAAKRAARLLRARTRRPAPAGSAGAATPIAAMPVSPALAPVPAPKPSGDAAVDAIVRAERARVAASSPAATVARARVRRGDPGIASTALWDEFFTDPDPWSYDTPYEQIKYDRTLAILPDEPLPRALELACAEGRFTERLAPRAGFLRATDISAVALDRTRTRCARFDNVDYAVLNFFEDGIGADWNLITCCEVLYYMASVAQLHRFAARVADALAPGGYFVQAHAFAVQDDPRSTGFDWEVPFSAHVIADAFDALPSLRRVRTIRTDLYRIDLFRRVGPDGVAAPPAAAPVEQTVPLGSALEPSVERWVIWNGPERTRGALAAARAGRVPVLMYHRIARDGPDALAPYRLDPASFEAQLLFLRRRGFRSVHLGEWRRNRFRLSLSGRPVLITFDDAYADFGEVAWPLLRRYDFTAHVFVPTDHVGGAADWDRAAGPPAPLLDWRAIASLAADGVTFGSHLASHPAVDLTDNESLLREATRSKATLEAVLGEAVTSFAAPYGIANSRTDGIMRLAGYTTGFRDGGGPARVHALGIATPRIEIAGGITLDAFARRLGVAVEAPNGRDTPPRF